MGERTDIDALDPTLDVGDAPTLASDSARDRSMPGIAVAPLEPGVRLGRYRLGNRLGAGAMGVVWAARDPNLDRPVAIKVVHPEFARAPDAAARLLREARAMAKVSHPGVVAVYDAGQAGEQLFLAMELVPGTTLGKLMRERTAAELADWRRWLAMLVDAGRGLAAAHAAGIVHRDFKPDNVLVGAGGRVCVGDFGVAELSLVPRGAEVAPGASVDNLSIADLTMTGALLGTPAYMSPEQLRGQDADARADQFSFCASAFEALYGVRPFALPPRTDPSPVTTLIAAIEGGQLQPPPRDARVPRAIHDAIVRGLAPAPGARWPSMDALLAALA
ncbi:MAG: serine/threonine protein kinase, partial [Deltaproteobacteria bacterium]|nr:serine/threonine protein kinase [Deltaproteobacteria bacterium]